MRAVAFLSTVRHQPGPRASIRLAQAAAATSGAAIPGEPASEVELPPTAHRPPEPRVRLPLMAARPAKAVPPSRVAPRELAGKAASRAKRAAAAGKALRAPRTSP